MITAQSVRRRAGGVFFGWWIIAAGMCIQTLTHGLFSQLYGAYVVLLREEFGWSKTAFSLVYAVHPTESALLGPIHGWMLDRFGPRAVMGAGLGIFGLGFILFSQIHSITAFYVCFLLLSLGSSLGGFFSITVSVVNWFERKRSTAIGLINVGMALGGLSVPIGAWALSTFGWRDVAFASGLIFWVVGIPLTRLIRHRPEDYGQRPDGARRDEAASSSEGDAGPVEIGGFTVREAVRTPAFWLISAGHATALLVVSALQVHLVLHLTQGLHYSLSGAAGIISVMTLAMMGGNLISGVMGDRMSKRLLAGLAMLGHAGAVLTLALANAIAPIILFAVLQGLAHGTRGVLMQTIRADYFGRRAFGKIMGFSNTVVMAGMIGGPIFAGVMSDQLGDYRLSFIILSGLAALGSLFFFFARRPDPPARPADVEGEGIALAQPAGA